MAATAQEIKEGPGVPLVFKIGAVLAYIVLLLPVLIVVLAGLNSGDYLTFPPQGISLRWVIDFLTSGTFLKAFLFSFILAIMTMAISTTLGTMAAVFLSRVKFPGKNLTRAFFLSPIILPGIILGLALYVFYATTFTGLLRTLPGLLLGHVLVTLPFVIGAVSAALANYDVSLEDAARSLGAGPLKAFRKVTLPNISNGVMAGSIFAFIVSFGQFDISLFLSTPNFTPLPIAMYVSLRYKFEPTAAAAGIFAITLVTVSMIVTSKLISFKKFSGVKF
jgi:putative spermidine/putrescine transport system permease protein